MWLEARGMTNIKQDRKSDRHLDCENEAYRWTDVSLKKKSRETVVKEPQDIVQRQFLDVVLVGLLTFPSHN